MVVWGGELYLPTLLSWLDLLCSFLIGLFFYYWVVRVLWIWLILDPYQVYVSQIFYPTLYVGVFFYLIVSVLWTKSIFSFDKFLYMVEGRTPTSFFCMLIHTCPSSVCWKDYSSRHWITLAPNAIFNVLRENNVNLEFYAKITVFQ